jgi:hypothetical protein
VLVHIGQSATHTFHVGHLYFLFVHASVHLQCLCSSHQNGEFWRDARLSALNVEELFSTQIGTETCLRDGIIAEGHGHFGSQHAVATMCNVGKRTAMDECGRVLDGLNHIGMDGIVQDGDDSSTNAKILNRERLALKRYAQQHVINASAQVFLACCQAEDGHYLRGGRDIEAPFGNDAVGFTAQPSNDGTQIAVVHIKNAAPQHFFHAESIVLVLVYIIV